MTVHSVAQPERLPRLSLAEWVAVVVQDGMVHVG
jgi:hypothetical protein